MNTLAARITAFVVPLQKAWSALFGGTLWVAPEEESAAYSVAVSRNAENPLWLLADPKAADTVLAQSLLENWAALIARHVEEVETAAGLTNEIITAWNRLSFLNDVIALMRITTNPRERSLKSLRLISKTIQVENAFIADASPSGVAISWVGSFEANDLAASIVDALKTERRKRVVCNTPEECQRLLRQAPGVTSFVGQEVFDMDSTLTFVGMINHADGSFNAGDLQIFDSLVQMISVFMESGVLHEHQSAAAQVEHDLKIAEEIQTSLLPKDLPDLPEYELNARMIPAARLGGDFYDIVEQGTGHQAIVVCDVAGKGIPAALLAAEMRAIVRSKLKNPLPAGDVLNETNADLFIDMERSERFATMMLLQLPVGGGELRYASAGHTNALCVRSGQIDLQQFGSTTLPLGVLDEVGTQDLPITLEHGDSLLIYSDGLTEAQNETGELVGEEGVIALLLAVHSAPASFIVDSLIERTTKYRRGQPLSDDLTVVAIKRKTPEWVDPVYLNRLHLPDDLAVLNQLDRQLNVFEDYLPPGQETARWLMEVKLAATEAVTNIIRHGYHEANLRGEVHGLIALFPDRIQIDLVDRGQPYQPQEVKPLNLDSDDLQEGGFGLHIIDSVMDSMTYKRIADSYNFWRFVRALKSGD